MGKNWINNKTPKKKKTQNKIARKQTRTENEFMYVLCTDQ